MKEIPWKGRGTRARKIRNRRNYSLGIEEVACERTEVAKFHTYHSYSQNFRAYPGTWIGMHENLRISE